MDLRNVFRRGPVIVGRLFKRLDPQEAKISVFEHPSSAKEGILTCAKIRLSDLIVEKGQSREQIGHLHERVFALQGQNHFKTQEVGVEDCHQHRFQLDLSVIVVEPDLVKGSEVFDVVEDDSRQFLGQGIDGVPVFLFGSDVDDFDGRGQCQIECDVE